MSTIPLPPSLLGSVTLTLLDLIWCLWWFVSCTRTLLCRSPNSVADQEITPNEYVKAAEAAERTWKYLKKSYVSSRTSELGSSLPWQFEKQMEFLIPHIESDEMLSGQENTCGLLREDNASDVEKGSKDLSSEGGSNQRSSTDDMQYITLRIDEDDDDDDDDMFDLTPKKVVPSTSGLGKQAEKSKQETVSRIKEWVNQASSSKFEPYRESISMVQDGDDSLKFDDFLRRETSDFETMRRQTEAELREKSHRQSRERSKRSDVSNTMRGWRSRRREEMIHSQERRQKVALQKQMIEECTQRLKKQVQLTESDEMLSGQKEMCGPLGEDVAGDVEKRSKDHSSEDGSNQRSSTDDMQNITLRIDEDDDDDDDDMFDLTPKKVVPSTSGLGNQAENSEQEGVSRIKEWVNEASRSKFEPDRDSISVVDDDEDSPIQLDDFLRREARDFEAMRRQAEAELREKFRKQSREKSKRSDVSNTMRGWRSRRREEILHNREKRKKLALQKQIIDERMRRLKKQRRRLDRLSLSDWDDRSVTSSVLNRQPYQRDIHPSHVPGPRSVSSYEDDSGEWELASIPESSVPESVSDVGNRASKGRKGTRRSTRTRTRKHMTAQGHFDEEDIFYLSMARMCSKFSPEDQAMLKYKLTNYVQDLEQQAREEAGLEEPSEEKA